MGRRWFWISQLVLIAVVSSKQLWRKPADLEELDNPNDQRDNRKFRMIICHCDVLILIFGYPGVLSLFAIVSFKNEECLTASNAGLKGTCLSSTECESQGGNIDGNCAAAFGVCCIFLLSACGGTITRVKVSLVAIFTCIFYLLLLTVD